jgi:hypothetical protein
VHRHVTQSTNCRIGVFLFDYVSVPESSRASGIDNQLTCSLSSSIEGNEGALPSRHDKIDAPMALSSDSESIGICLASAMIPAGDASPNCDDGYTMV